MKRALAPALLLVVVASVAAIAAPVPRAVVSGATPQTYTAAGSAQILVQCPGQVISFRPMTATEVHDAGVSDIRMDFVANPDAYPIKLTPEQTRINFKNIDAGSVACNLSDNL